MRVLQICNKLPCPPLDGGSLVMHNTTVGLLDAGVEVHLFAVSTPKQPVLLDQLPDGYAQSVDLQYVTIDTRVQVSGALVNLFSDLPYHVSRYQTAHCAHKLTEILTTYQYDVVQFESLYMLVYLPLVRQLSTAQVVYRSQNVEHQIWQRVTENTRNPFKKAWLKLQTERLRRFEQHMLEQVDGCIGITDNDSAGMRKLSPNLRCITVPLGVQMSKYTDLSAQNLPERSVFHLGSMDWYPNEEAVRWLLEDVWPLVTDTTIKLCLAGKHMPAWVHAHASERIRVLDRINTPIDYMAQRGVMVVPLLSGSGIRVKILEGMALGKVIVTTTIGAQGIPVEDAKQVLIADTAAHFARQITVAFTQAQLGASARNMIEEQYNLRLLTQKMLDFYATLAAQRV